MLNSESLNYQRISDAIEYIQEHFQNQPDLDMVASHVHLSSFHIQRLFTEWAGVSPKKFLQYISTEYAKQVLKEEQMNLADAAFYTGLSGTGRLHDLFVSIEGMTPGEFKNGGKNLSVAYDFLISPFGKLIVAATQKGICYMHFEEDEKSALNDLILSYPNAEFRRYSNPSFNTIRQLFEPDSSNSGQLNLHLKGTPFQLKIWEALLRIPAGKLTTYGALAKNLTCPNASRAVGTAIGKNPVALLIPCHRVIRSGGIIGGYRWGTARKKAIIGWEAAKRNS